MKITIINLKQIIKYIFIFFVVSMIVLMIKSVFKKENKNQELVLIECLQYELPIINTTTEEIGSKENLSINILSTQIGVLKSTKDSSQINKEQTTFPLEKDLQEESNVVEKDLSNIQQEDGTTKETKVLEENNIKATYTDEYNEVKVNNQTNYDITEIIQNSTYNLTNKEKVLIYHTHTCESYTATEAHNYEMTDAYRTTNLNFTVARVGDELETQLQKYGFGVVHNKTYHDYPSYSGSYGRSLKTLQNMISSNNDAEIAIDLHRDAVGSMSNYAPRVQIGDEVCAQVMFVIGTDGSGLAHANWRENFKFAIKVQQIANELYPGLFRPIILRNARYNQHLTTASTIIEVGATGNTLEECVASMKYLAEVLYQVTR